MTPPRVVTPDRTAPVARAKESESGKAPGDTVLISYCGRTEFAIVQGKALITTEGEALEGEALDDTTVHGVVTHFLNRVDRQEGDPIPVM